MLRPNFFFYILRPMSYLEIVGVLLIIGVVTAVLIWRACRVEQREEWQDRGRR